MFETPGVTQAKASMQALLETPGARKFDEVFGEGASQHLISASDPVSIAGLALPFMRAGDDRHCAHSPPALIFSCIAKE